MPPVRTPYSHERPAHNVAHCPIGDAGLVHGMEAPQQLQRPDVLFGVLAQLALDAGRRQGSAGPLVELLQPAQGFVKFLRTDTSACLARGAVKRSPTRAYCRA